MEGFVLYKPNSSQARASVLTPGRVCVYRCETGKSSPLVSLTMNPADFGTHLGGAMHVRLYWNAERRQIGVEPCEATDAGALKPNHVNSHQVLITLKGFEQRFGIKIPHLTGGNISTSGPFTTIQLDDYGA